MYKGGESQIRLTRFARSEKVLKSRLSMVAMGKNKKPVRYERFMEEESHMARWV